MKYRKKPVVIEAEQWNGEHPFKGVCYCTSQPNSTLVPGKMGLAHVHTMHDNQTVVLEAGDWIIPEPDGEHFYPCKSDVFLKTYEAVE